MPYPTLTPINERTGETWQKGEPFHYAEFDTDENRKLVKKKGRFLLPCINRMGECIRSYPRVFGRRDRDRKAPVSQLASSAKGVCTPSQQEKRDRSIGMVTAALGASIQQDDEWGHGKIQRNQALKRAARDGRQIVEAVTGFKVKYHEYRIGNRVVKCDVGPATFLQSLRLKSWRPYYRPYLDALAHLSKLNRTLEDYSAFYIQLGNIETREIPRLIGRGFKIEIL